MAGASDAFRLPRNVSPIHYALTIKSDLDKLTFEGHVIVDLAVHEATSSIVLHAMPSLLLSRAALLSGTKETAATAIERDEKSARATIRFSETLSPGADVQLTIAFSAAIDASKNGYNYSKAEVDGKSIIYTHTMMAPLSARKAFPCWDEPALKATFALTLIAKKDLVALANMPVKRSFDGNGLLSSSFSEQGEEASSSGEWTVWQFETTPKISTYLVAYSVGTLSCLETAYESHLTGRRVPVAFYSSADVIHQGKVLLDVSARAVPVYEQIFDIEYPLPKLDTLAVSNFEPGAMENWGLIMGRDYLYLYDDQKSGLADLKRLASVQIHEIAHQWFGNIVTMEWWDNLWLNESFATFVADVIVTREMYPEWRADSIFVNVQLKRALTLDALRSSHPIEMPCPDPGLIDQIFDAISYSKGASVIRMLVNVIGEKTFLKGVSNYLKRHLYGNTRTEDLWAAIADISGRDIARIAANWISNTGFPVVSVEETSQGLKIRQNRFLSTADVKPDEDETLWYIPLELKTVGEDGKASIDHSAVLDEKREITIPLANATQSVYKLNAETAGVYRVCYSPERLAVLGEEAAREGGVFSLNDRMGLVQDAHVLAKAGYGKTSGALNLLSKLANEKENLVWAEIDAAFIDLASVWWEEPERIRKGLQAFRRDLFRPVFARLGHDPRKAESPDDTELRKTALMSLVAADDQETIKEIQRRLEPFFAHDDDSLISTDLRTPYYIAAVRHGGEQAFEKMLSIYEKPTDPGASFAAIAALSNSPLAKDKVFKLLLSGRLKDADLIFFLREMSANRETRRPLCDFLQMQFDWIMTRFKGTYALQSMMQRSIDMLTSLDDVEAIQAFHATHDTSAYDQTLSQAFDSIRSRAGWLSRAREDVESWLQANNYL